ncbi:BTAD domain-containing putative transcriptional regulator [Streptomyces sp. Tu102]|uniref:AfsR/SARP family transcriptional regulator n=1 Tax=Streptomyces sp. Tu102 TaxID=2838019 RepID=UPI001BDCDBD7|nr:BTAD domain-containing putative transcriptional regulator [Streptomyces sp. Tu102]MBT1090308.1 SARP family transcriptional regulator [Streptomyces sp. Tu102]
MDATLTVPALRLLGRFQLSYGPQAVDVTAAGQRVLAFLGLRSRATRSVVAGTLWPEVTEERAQGSLRTALWRLGRGPGRLVDCRHDTLALAADVHTDVRALTSTALSLVDSSPAADESAALGALCGGDLLPGWDEDWVALERERLRQLRLHALDSLAARLLAQGQHALALEAALESVRIEPLRESAHRAVVSVHLAEHNVAEAVRHFEAFRRLLRKELGVQPSAGFAAMVQHRCHA